jgi:hypothetical protein
MIVYSALAQSLIEAASAPIGYVATQFAASPAGQSGDRGGPLPSDLRSRQRHIIQTEHQPTASSVYLRSGNK